MITLAAVLTAVVVLSTSYLLVKRISSKRRSDVSRLPYPGENKHWFWGHEKWTQFEGSYGDAHNELHEKYGHALRIKAALFHDDILVLSDPAAITHIFTTHTYSYTKSLVFRPLLERLLGKSIVWAEGESLHGRMRNLLNPVFSAENVRSFQDDIVDIAQRLKSLLEAHIYQAEEANEKKVIIDSTEWSGKATADIIGKVGFGHDFGATDVEIPEEKKEDANDIAQLWLDQVNLGTTNAGFIAALVLRAAPWITSLPFKSVQAQGATKLRIRALAEQLAEKGLADPEVTKGRDLLSTLIRATSRADEPISKDELLDHICTFVIVGHETTAGVLSFTLHALAQNQQVQSTLREELRSYGGSLGYDDLNSGLPYLDACVKEGLRLFPASPHSEKVAVHDDVIPLRYPVRTPSGELITSLRVTKDQLIYISSYSVNTLPSVWGPTAGVYDPSRWLSSTPGALPKPSEMTQGWSGLFTFSEGPRICLGYRMAVYEFKVILATLIKNFVFTDTGAVLERKFAATLHSRVIGQEAKGRALPIGVEIAS